MTATSVRSRSQQGTALLIVLGAIALTAVVVTSLLGLTLASLRLTAAQSHQATQDRAADGALEVAMGRVIRSDADDPCEAIAGPHGARVTFPDVGGTNPSIEVSTECTKLPLPPDDPTAVLGVPLGGPRVEVVGNRYDGGVAVPGGFAEHSTLVHTGSQALRFTADVDVANGAAARSTLAGGPSAVIADGQYAQGLPGPGASAELSCGVLAPSGPDPATAISDRDNTPTCDDDAAAAVRPRHGSLFTPGETIVKRTVPSTCPNAGGPNQVAFQPGQYDAVETAKLNRMLDGVGDNILSQCAGRTYWFRPGKYLFDVNDAANPSADRNALVIKDPTVKVIFGAPSGVNAPSSVFPHACDPFASGASIELSARSAIRHRAGRVAICPVISANGTVLPAVVQSQVAPSQPILVEATAGGSPVSFPHSFGPIDASAVSCRLPVPHEDCVRTMRTKWASTGTTTLASAELQLRSSEWPNVHDADREIEVQVTNGSFECYARYQPTGRTGDLYTTVDLLRSTSGGSCHNPRTDLLFPGLKGADQSIFDGATITVRHWFRGGKCLIIAACPVRLTVSDVRLRINSAVVEAGGVEVAPDTGPWDAPDPDDVGAYLDHVRTSGGAATTVTASQGGACAGLENINPNYLDDPRCRSGDPGDWGFTLTDFDPTAVRDRDDHVETLGMRINSYSGNKDSWASIPRDKTWFRFELLLSDGSSCTVEKQGFARSPLGIHVDLIEEGGSCRSIVETVDDLEGADVRFTIRADCAWFNETRPFNWPSYSPGDPCYMVTLPDLDRVAMVLTTDSPPKSPPFEASMNTTAGNQLATFNVFGDVLVPASTFDVRWKGPADSTPIVSGNLSVKALGSDMTASAQMGVVCCALPQVETIRLTAVIGGVPTAEVDVYVGRPRRLPTGLTERVVKVLDWRFCGGRGCAAVLSNVEISGGDDDEGGG